MFLLVFAGHVLFIRTLAGQTGGLISGTITDPSGAAIPGATVSVKSEKTGDERKAVSGLLRPLFCDQPVAGILRHRSKSPALGPTQFAKHPACRWSGTRLNIVLQPAAITQEVNVSSGELTAIDTSSARIGRM